MLKLFGDANAKEIKRLEPLVLRAHEFEKEIEKLSDQDLRQKTEEFRTRLEQGVALDDLLPEAFACVREAAKRMLKQRHFDVQLLGGAVLHSGKIAEMRTGEGKTLAATAPAYLNALTSKGVHIVTVNDYLAKRDTVWMGQIYNALGMTVGCVTQAGSYIYDLGHRRPENPEDAHDKERDTVGAFKVLEDFLRPAEKKEAYACDITHGTNNEFGFDYLRDNMAQSLGEMAQRGHYFAIVDEVDSILIDEARTPLIISAPDVESPKFYDLFAKIGPRLKEDEDYNVDEKRRAVTATEEGIRKVEQMLNIPNLYEEGVRMVHYLEQALRAQALYKLDRDYVVKDGEIVIVDEFTGRLMPGRRWSEGLHQAIEAKEGMKVQAESKTLATITFQNYFRLYEKLSGMTGTAVTSAEELAKVYKLEVVIVPTAKPMVREDLPDMVYRTETGKWKAIVREIKVRHEKGQPVLVGTTSIDKNEKLGTLLVREGIPHEILNAKNHEREGQIIAQAGAAGSTTVATNMAGRGVDIILGGNPPEAEEAKKIREAGGLTVIGTERHEARRIDNQLRGRAGRQGDPGVSQFFMSLEDDLLRVFGGNMVQNLMAKLNVPEDEPIISGLVSKAIAQAQARIEGFNFDMRKHLLEYDDVMNKHREAIYRRRREILESKEPFVILDELIAEEIEALLGVHSGSEYPAEWNVEEIAETLKTICPVPHDAKSQLVAIVEGKGPEASQQHRSGENAEDRRTELSQWCMGYVNAAKEERLKALGKESAEELSRQAMLRSIDLLWIEHLETMEALRDAVRLRAYGQKDPLVEYKNDAHRIFRQLSATVRSNAIRMFFNAQINTQRQESKIFSQQTPMMTNKDEQNAKAKPVKSGEPGRNDPCPCGSGKKYKKCGMVNAPSHRQ